MENKNFHGKGEKKWKAYENAISCVSFVASLLQCCRESKNCYKKREKKGKVYENLWNILDYYITFAYEICVMT